MLRTITLTASLALAALATPAVAYEYAHTKCTTAYGDRVEAYVREGKAVIRHNGGAWAPAFTKRDGNIGIIQQVGTHGIMTLATTLTGGRAYIITDFDDRPQIKANAWCTHQVK